TNNTRDPEAGLHSLRLSTCAARLLTARRCDSLANLQALKPDKPPGAGRFRHRKNGGIMAETTGPRAPARALSRGMVPAIMVGTIAGLDNIATGLAIASLLFAGSLAAGLGLAVI